MVLLDSTTKEQKVYGYFLQYGATAHIATYPLDDLNKVCEERLVNCRLWPARSPDLKSI
jgi:hypothetical protein